MRTHTGVPLNISPQRLEREKKHTRMQRERLKMAVQASWSEKLTLFDQMKTKKTTTGKCTTTQICKH